MSQSMQPFGKQKTSNVLIPNFSAPAGASRFEKFIGIADRLVIGLPAEQQLILCVLTYEAVPNYQGLIECLNSIKDGIQMTGETHVVWSGSNFGLNTRSLDARTVIAASRVSSTPNWPEEIVRFKSILIDNYPGSRQCLSRDFWEVFFHDVTAWLYLNIPKVVLSLLVGEITCTTLSKEVLVREKNFNLRVRSSKLADPDSGLSPAHDEAMDNLVDEENERGRARYLTEILDIFSGARSDEIRLSDTSWRASLELRLAAVAEVVSKNGTDTDAVLLLWIHYLLTVGSLRLKNPTVATLARYVSAIGSIISEKIGAAQSSVMYMEEEDWYELFSQMAEAVQTNEQKTSLAAFHKFCVDVFGVQPQAKLIFSTEDVDSRVNANLVWDHEIDQCFSAIDTIADDSKVRQRVEVLLAMAICFPLRIGEVHGLRLEDFTVEGDVVEVRYHPHASQHQGKSPQAKRVMRSSDSRFIFHVIRWLNRRKKEEKDGLGERAFFFGDPHQPMKTYRFGMCVRLLNTILKDAAGDRTVSFHTLRHRWVNGEVLKVIEKGENFGTVDPLQKIAVQVGHNDVRTTLRHYFHLPASALRISLDFVFMQKEIPSATASFWLNASSPSLRKAKQRAFQKSGYYWHKLQQHSRSLFRVDVGLDVEAVEGVSAGDVQAAAGSLGLLRKVMADMQQGFTLQTSCLRCSVDHEYVAEVLQAALKVMEALDSHQGQTEVDDAPWYASPEKQWLWVKRKLEFHDINVDLQAEPTSEKLLEKQLLAEAPTQLQKRAVRAWLDCKWRSGMAMKNLGKTEPLLAWLREGGVPATALVLRLPAEELDSPLVRARVLSSHAATSTEAAISNFFGRGYVVELVRRRSKADGPYLLVARVPVMQKVKVVSSAMLRMGRLHGLLFSMAVWIEMHDKDAHEKR